MLIFCGQELVLKRESAELEHIGGVLIKKHD